MARDQLLARCSAVSEENLRRFEEFAAQVSSHQAAWQPARGKWSVAECVEHLNLSLELFIDELGPALRRARRRGLIGTGPWKRRTVPGSLLLRSLNPAANRSLPAPKAFRPAGENLDFADVSERFRSGIASLIDLALEADGLNLDRVRLPIPVSRMLRITAAEGFRIQARHIPRHLSQAEAVTRRPDFPGSLPYALL